MRSRYISAATSPRPLHALRRDARARGAVESAADYDQKRGSGDSMDFGLRCYEMGRLHGIVAQAGRKSPRRVFFGRQTPKEAQ